MGWLKEWDKCVFKRANPVKKRRFNDDEEDPYVCYLRVVIADSRPTISVDQEKGYVALSLKMIAHLLTTGDSSVWSTGIWENDSGPHCSATGRL